MVQVGIPHVIYEILTEIQMSENEIILKGSTAINSCSYMIIN